MHQKIPYILFQSTLSVRRATGTIGHLGQIHIISIHALREESDELQAVLQNQWNISIHALREESDRPASRPCESGKDFNPRSP